MKFSFDFILESLTSDHAGKVGTDCTNWWCEAKRKQAKTLIIKELLKLETSTNLRKTEYNLPKPTFSLQTVVTNTQTKLAQSYLFSVQLWCILMRISLSACGKLFRFGLDLLALYNIQHAWNIQAVHVRVRCCLQLHAFICFGCKYAHMYAYGNFSY